MIQIIFIDRRQIVPAIYRFAVCVRFPWANKNPGDDVLSENALRALEIGGASNPSSVAFHANVSEYIATLITSHSQPKRKWLMMQMTETHPERRVVRRAITHDTWGEGDVRLTPERRGKMGGREHVRDLGIESWGGTRDWARGGES
mgnify:CR=1 FL=1